MTLNIALRICTNTDLYPLGFDVFFTNLVLGKSFNPEKARTSRRSSPVFNSKETSHEEIFSAGLKYKNIVMISRDEESPRVIAEPFTPTSQEIEKCEKYLNDKENYTFDSQTYSGKGIPFVRRRKPGDLYEKLAFKVDEYIVKNRLRLCDPEEEDFGQRISSFYLADAVAGDEALEKKVEKITKRQLQALCFRFYERVIWIDEDADVEYGEVFMLDYRKGRGERAVMDIWDGYP